MDIDGTNSLPNGHQNSMGSTMVNEEKKSMKRDHSNPLFVNYDSIDIVRFCVKKGRKMDMFKINDAELAWHEMRRAWVGDRSQTSHSTSHNNCRQPIMSWITSFADLLASGEPFPEPVSLVDVVDLLVDIWIDECN